MWKTRRIVSELTLVKGLGEMFLCISHIICNFALVTKTV